MSADPQPIDAIAAAIHSTVRSLERGVDPFSASAALALLMLEVGASHPDWAARALEEIDQRDHVGGQGESAHIRRNVARRIVAAVEVAS